MHGLKAALWVTSLIGMLSMTGCFAKRISVDGNADVNESFYLAAKARVEKRAAFELSCPAEKLKIVVLAVKGTDATSGTYVNQLGVEGCGKKMVYVNAAQYWTQHEWVANTKTESE